MTIDKSFIDDLLDKAALNPRLRINHDMRTTDLDGSQRMLNALMPGTIFEIHRHPHSDESVLIICGSIDEVFFNDNGEETARIHLNHEQGQFGCQVPRGVWHTIEVYEPSVIFESKDGAYGHDGSEFLNEANKVNGVSFQNSLGDLKKNIEYLIGMERHSGSMEVITPLYVSRMLNVPLDEVEKTMKEMGL